MTYAVELSARADDDLRGIFAYIAYGLKSIQNAIGQIERLEQGILGLDELPERFRRYEKRTVVQPGAEDYAGRQVSGILYGG